MGQIYSSFFRSKDSEINEDISKLTADACFIKGIALTKECDGLSELQAKQQIKLAFRYLENAAMNGHVEAQWRCGVMNICMPSIFGKEGEIEAFKRFKSGQAKSTQTQLMLALMLNEGRGCDKDVEGAFKAFQQASESFKGSEETWKGAVLQVVNAWSKEPQEIDRVLIIIGTMNHALMQSREAKPVKSLLSTVPAKSVDVEPLALETKITSKNKKSSKKPKLTQSSEQPKLESTIMPSHPENTDLKQQRQQKKAQEFQSELDKALEAEKNKQEKVRQKRSRRKKVQGKAIHLEGVVESPSLESPSLESPELANALSVTQLAIESPVSVVSSPLPSAAKTLLPLAPPVPQLAAKRKDTTSVSTTLSSPSTPAVRASKNVANSQDLSRAPLWSQLVAGKTETKPASTASSLTLAVKTSESVADSQSLPRGPILSQWGVKRKEEAPLIAAPSSSASIVKTSESVKQNRSLFVAAPLVTPTAALPVTAVHENAGETQETKKQPHLSHFPELSAAHQKAILGFVKRCKEDKAVACEVHVKGSFLAQNYFLMENRQAPFTPNDLDLYIQLKDFSSRANIIALIKATFGEIETEFSTPYYTTLSFKGIKCDFTIPNFGYSSPDPVVLTKHHMRLLEDGSMECVDLQGAQRIKRMFEQRLYSVDLPMLSAPITPATYPQGLLKQVLKYYYKLKIGTPESYFKLDPDSSEKLFNFEWCQGFLGKIYSHESGRIFREEVLGLIKADFFDKPEAAIIIKAFVAVLIEAIEKESGRCFEKDQKAALIEKAHQSIIAGYAKTKSKLQSESTSGARPNYSDWFQNLINTNVMAEIFYHPKIENSYRYKASCDKVLNRLFPIAGSYRTLQGSGVTAPPFGSPFRASYSGVGMMGHEYKEKSSETANSLSSGIKPQLNT